MNKAILLLTVICLLAAPLRSTAQAGYGDPSTLAAETAAFMQKYGLNESNFSCSYYNTATGESYSYNEN